MTVIAMGDLARFHASRKSAGAVAVAYGDDVLTWDELDRQANRLARLYRSLGVRAGDRVALALENSTRYHVAAFAIWKLGAAPAALSPKLTVGEFAAVLEIMQPRLLITASADAGRDLPVVVVGLDAPDQVYPADLLAAEVSPYWKVSTSGGSTGRPKVIIHDTPAALDLETARLFEEFRMPPDGVVLNPGPLYHNAPFLFSSYGLFAGSTVIGMTRFDPEEALRLIETHRVNWVSLVPTMMHRIWSLPPEVRNRYDLSSLTTVWHMAAACPAWLKEAWIDWLGPERIWERYGGTEGFGGTIISGGEWLERRGSVGRVAGAARLKIVSESGAPCGPDEVGELWFLPAGDKPPAYYLGMETPRDAEGYLTLGDLGRRDEDGYVYIADRRTDLIIRGGANIYPAEIEAALEAHPDVAAAVVIGLPDDELGERVHAIVQPRPGVTVDLASVSASLAGRLVKYKWPESLEVQPGPLRDDAGKVRRSALRDQRISWLKAGARFGVSAKELARSAVAAT